MTSWSSWASANDESHPSWFWMAILSLVLHGAFFMGLWAMDRYSASWTSRPKVISVRLVGASAKVGAAPQEAPVAKPEKQERRTRIRRPIPRTERKAVSINPQAVKPPKPSRPKRQRVERPKPASPSAPKAKSQPARTGPAVAAALPAGGQGSLNSEEARYISMLQERIEENWRAYLPPEGEVLGEVQIEIARNGQIASLTFLKGSGMAYVDASIVRALKRVALPPPPATLADRPLILRFWPSGPRSGSSSP